MTWVIWILIAISIVGGATWKARALPLPILYVAALYLAELFGGGFVSQTDNLAAIAFAGAVVVCLIGLALVCVGWVLRVGADRIRRRRGGSDEARFKH